MNCTLISNDKQLVTNYQLLYQIVKKCKLAKLLKSTMNLKSKIKKMLNVVYYHKNLELCHDFHL